jgi:hypothetical protein
VQPQIIGCFGQKRYYDVSSSVQDVHVYWRDGMEDPERIENSLRNIFGGDKKVFTINFHYKPFVRFSGSEVRKRLN